MEQTLDIFDFGLQNANVKIMKKMTDNIVKLNKCNQCEYTSSRAENLRQHLKTHSGEKLNKCKQCDYASSRAGHLRTHLKTHSGEKLKKMQAMRLCIF